MRVQRAMRDRAATFLLRRRVPGGCRAVVAAAALLAGSFTGVLVTPAASAATPPWMDASQTPAQRAAEVLAVMTLDDKLSLMHNTTSCQYAGCTPSSFSGGTLPALHLQDGPVGVGDGVTDVTQLPAPVAGAASWDTSLMQQYGSVLGSEQWGKGVNVVLAPTVNIVRDPRWGRAFESLGEDPYLAGQIGAADISGIQAQGPMAQVKHYAVYNQETNRNSTSDNAIVDERTLREIYLPQFEAAINQGNVASVMCSYSTVNGQYACENSHLQNDILKGSQGFAGFITSDWGGTHSTVASANNGLDMEMPDSDLYYGSALKTAVQNGQVSQATIDDHVRRILTEMFRFGLFDKSQTGTKSSVVTSSAHTATALQVAEQGSVLLKNSGPVLPLGTGAHTVAVIGADAGAQAQTQGGGSAGVNASYTVTPYAGIKNRAGSGASVNYYQGVAGSDGALPAVPASALTPSQGSGNGLYGQFFANTGLTGAAVATRTDQNLDFNWAGASPNAGVATTNWSAKWTGAVHPPTTGSYTFSLTSDDGSRLYVNGQLVIGNWADQGSTTKTGTVTLTAGQAATVEVDYYQGGGSDNLTLGWQVPGQSLQDQAVTGAKSADVAVVFVSKYESEGYDVGDIDLGSAQNNLVSAVAAANPNTVVVLNTGSAVTMPWVAGVKGVVEAWYPGQEDGNAIAALLYGDVNPSGKLPVTFPASLSDVPASTPAQWPGQNGTVQYSEGLGVGYRWYDGKSIAPLFPFGFGLSYTTFGYSGLTVGTPDAGGNVAVGFTVTNTGTRTGSEVAEVYVGEPAVTGEPPKSLQGFRKVALAAGASSQVSLTLPARAFQYWNGTGWTTAAGTSTVYVGASSRDLRLTGTVGTGSAETALPRTGWTATASSSAGGDVPSNALDGSASTRWSTGTAMANGQYYQVDLGTARTFDQVTVDAGGSTGDYPRGLSVQVSGDGASWTPVASATAVTASQTVTFAQQTARYLRLVQTGSSTSWWSIAELTVSAASGGSTGGSPTALARGGWTASANPSSGDAPANVLDGNLGTRFSTGTAMASGQYLQVDTGSAHTFDQVVMDSGGSSADYARGYTVQVSNDASSWTTVSTGAGTAAVVTARFANQSARYVRIVQTGSSSSWWSVAELNLYAG